MKWDRDLDNVEKKALHDLKAMGYKAVDKKHIIHFKEIYEFISRFADPMYSGNVNLSMTSGPIPAKTAKIVRTIGAENLFMYFSMQAYQDKFMRFCEKLILTKHIISSDYISNGTIIATEYEVEVTPYSDATHK